MGVAFGGKGAVDNADTVTIEFDELTAEQVDLITAHHLATGVPMPVKTLPLWRGRFRVDPPLSKSDIAADVHLWAVSQGIPFRKLLE